MKELQADIAEASDHKLFELFIVTVIFANIIIMSLEYHNNSAELKKFIEKSNAVSIQLQPASAKLIMNPPKYMYLLLW